MHRASHESRGYAPPQLGGSFETLKDALTRQPSSPSIGTSEAVQATISSCDTLSSESVGASAEVAPGQEGSVPELVAVVGGLEGFLRGTVPSIEVSMCERLVGEAEKDLRARAVAETGKVCIGIMDKTSAR